MTKQVMLRTILLICLIIIGGFTVITVLNYRTSINVAMKEIESVSALTTEGIYYRLTGIFTKPVNISLTMANDNLLIELLEEEEARKNDPDYLKSIRDYLRAYLNKYAYDSIFLASATTKRYYNFNGIDRMLYEGNPENHWYYTFLEKNEDISLEVDNDEAAENEITVFINCMIRGEGGRPLGVVGVGFRVDDMQKLLKDYENQYGVETFLINESGLLTLSTEQSGYEEIDFFGLSGYPELKEVILANKNTEGGNKFWLSEKNGRNYVTSQYIPELSWFLIIENNLRQRDDDLRQQIISRMTIALLVLGAVLFIVNKVVRKYNKEIVELTTLREQERQAAFREATERQYDSIHEVDISGNQAVGKNTRSYFAAFGLAGDEPYDQMLRHIAANFVQADYRQGFLDTFLPENVLKTHSSGSNSLGFDFFMRDPGGDQYHWTRMVGYTFTGTEDDTVRMFTYQRNLNEVKLLADQARIDEMTGLLNKGFTRQMVEQTLVQSPGAAAAFFILDIDNFKQVNDLFGHAMGDAVITEFARIISCSFRSNDIIGRIGGDEFAAFVLVPKNHPGWPEEKALELARKLAGDYPVGATRYPLSASIGLALSPEAGSSFDDLYRNADKALYRTKKRGKNGYSIFDPKLDTE